MAAAKKGEINLAQLRSFLLSLGFEQPISVNRSQAFRHRKSGTVLVVSASGASGSLRPADLLSVLVRLECEGLASESDLRQLRLGKLPKAS